MEGKRQFDKFFEKTLSLCFSLSPFCISRCLRKSKKIKPWSLIKKKAPNAFKDLGSFIYVRHNFLIGLLDTSMVFFLPLKNRFQNTLWFCVQRAVTLYRNKNLFKKKHVHHRIYIMVLLLRYYVILAIYTWNKTAKSILCLCVFLIQTINETAGH